MTNLFPEIEPYNTGWLNVSNDNHLYYEQSGNFLGKPVIVLHGGPGSGCMPRMRRFFNPKKYRIILFDQRGCGRSTPHASQLSTDLTHNTTANLLLDIEQLRMQLGIDRWMVFGGSWGSVLGLLYAEKHPDHVTEIVLWGVAVGNSSEIKWMYEGIAPLLPQEWEIFIGGLNVQPDALSLLTEYSKRLNDPDEKIRLQAARKFHDWEWGLFNVDADKVPSGRWLEPEFQLARARIITHYFLHNCWLEEGEVLRNIDKIASIPGVLVQGRFDIASPLTSAWLLSKTWSNCELIIVKGAGHSTTDAGMDEALVSVTQRFVYDND